MVAIIQLAITLGAVVGGFIFDASGHASTFAVAAMILVAAALIAALTMQIAKLPACLMSRLSSSACLPGAG